MKVELFYSPGCPDCAAANEKLRLAAHEVVRNLEWCELSVLEEIDRAVALGVVTLPSIVVDDELVFTSMPSATQFREALVRRQGRL